MMMYKSLLYIKKTAAKAFNHIQQHVFTLHTPLQPAQQNFIIQLDTPSQGEAISNLLHMKDGYTICICVHSF
jgi:hypothetical protein